MATHGQKSKKFSPYPLIIAGVGLIVLALTIFLYGVNNSDRTASASGGGHSVVPVGVDYLAPELVLADVSGKPVSLVDLRGQIVLVNNWATWCPPCRAEMPELEAYYQAHKNQNFTLIGISAGDTATQVQNFTQQNGITFPMWLDPDNAALVAFRNNSLPSSYVIDKTGTIRLAWTGVISLEMLETHVTPLLRE
jgi:peroxiredoxin